MKPKKLTIINIGKIAKMVIEINKPLILFYGEIKQGKTTILNAVRWVCGGAFPDDIIRHGEKEGSIELEFDGGLISRSFYRSKSGKTEARAVAFIRNGKPVPAPVAEIKRLLNPFLLDQDFLRNKTELERKQYFTELFAVDTTELDAELFNNQREATSLRSKISGYGEIDMTRVDAVDIESLKSKRASTMQAYAAKKTALESKIREANKEHNRVCAAIDLENDGIRTANAAIDRELERKAAINAEIKKYEEAISKLKKELASIKPCPKFDLKPKPESPDYAAIEEELRSIVPNTSEIDLQIQEAGATNVRAQQYQANKKRSEERGADELKLSALEERGRKIKAEKQAKLKSIGDTCGIKGLSFDESGNFIYDGTTAGMISDSQIMRLSVELSSLYPPDFGMELLDRGESLGKSIFEFVDRATLENKSILATIVGERPATVPEHVGVFVVTEGALK